MMIQSSMVVNPLHPGHPGHPGHGGHGGGPHGPQPPPPPPSQLTIGVGPPGGHPHGGHGPMHPGGPPGHPGHPVHMGSPLGPPAGLPHGPPLSQQPPPPPPPPPQPPKQTLQPQQGPQQQPSTSQLRAVLSQRMKLLQCQLQSSSSSPGGSSGSSGSGGAGTTGNKSVRQLPCIEEAWNIPVSQEMASKQQQQQQQQQSLLHKGTYALGATLQRGHHPQGGPMYNGLNGPLSNGMEKPPFYLSNQDMQMLQQLQANVNNLIPHQRQLLHQLQNRHRMMMQHKAQMQQQQHNIQGNTDHPSASVKAEVSMSNGPQAFVMPQPPPAPHRNNTMVTANGVKQESPNETVLDSDSLTADSKGSIVDTKGSKDDSRDSKDGLGGSTTTTPVGIRTISSGTGTSKSSRLKGTNSIDDEDDDDEDTQDGCGQPIVESLKNSELAKLLRIGPSAVTCRVFEDPFANQPLPVDDAEPMDTDAVVLRKVDDANETVRRGRGRSKTAYGGSAVGELAFTPPSRVPDTLGGEATSDQIIHSCKGTLSKYGVPAMSIVHGYGGPPPRPPEPPAQLGRDKLLPQAPSVFLDNKKQAFTPQLQQFCNSNPITVVRNLGSVLKLDLGLFSTKCLVDANPDQPVEVRTQLQQGLDENWDGQRRAQLWRCESSKTRCTLSRYAQYQAASFQEQLREEQQGNNGSNSQPHLSDSDSNSSLGVFNTTGGPGGSGAGGNSGAVASKSKRAKKNAVFKTLKFGSHVDLSDEKRWRAQLQELQKLPPFTKVVSGCNMLSHIGRQMVGVNTVKLHLKVPGARTTGHQENNNFCSVNVNIGPGDCEWFATPHEYWGEVHRLCERAHVRFDGDSWWPLAEDLAAHHIPVYRFTQRPGDLVYVNYGTVHWVYSAGWCNNISWNVGPLCADQYLLAIERYEWNRLNGIRSLVPMQLLSWNLARNLQLADERLFRLLRDVLARSLRHCALLREWLKGLRKDVRWHGKARSEPTYYCTLCQAEVFNILFAKTRPGVDGHGPGQLSKRMEVHCFYCARKASPDLHEYVVLEEYSMNDLKDVYDHFQLREVAPSSSSIALS